MSKEYSVVINAFTYQDLVNVSDGVLEKFNARCNELVGSKIYLKSINKNITITRWYTQDNPYKLVKELHMLFTCDGEVTDEVGKELCLMLKSEVLGKSGVSKSYTISIGIYDGIREYDTILADKDMYKPLVGSTYCIKVGSNYEYITIRDFVECMDAEDYLKKRLVMTFDSEGYLLEDNRELKDEVRERISNILIEYRRKKERPKSEIRGEAAQKSENIKRRVDSISNEDMIILFIALLGLTIGYFIYLLSEIVFYIERV